jgi:hypothetical protein
MEHATLSIPRAQRRPRLFWVLSDTWELFKRTLIQIRQTPGDLVSFVIVQPVLLIVLFRYVFGGAVDTGETGYADFLIPGVIVANAALIGTTAAVGVALTSPRASSIASATSTSHPSSSSVSCTNRAPFIDSITARAGCRYRATRSARPRNPSASGGAAVSATSSP